MSTPKTPWMRRGASTSSRTVAKSRVTARRRLVVLAVLLALTGTLATACGGASTGKRTTLKIYNDKAAWTPFFNQIGGVAKSAIGVGLTPVGYADEPTYQAFVRSSLRTNARPDLFTWATGPLLAQLATGGQVADTSALWQQSIADGNLPQSLEKYFTVNGQQYCVPLNVSYWVMFYNKKVFADAGITATPTTWQQLMSDAATLKAHGDTAFYQTNVLFSFVWFQTLVAGIDPNFYTQLTEGKASYTDPVAVQAMQLWKGMIQNGYMSDPGDKTDPATLLKTGKVAMVPDGTWFNTSMVQAGMKSGVDYGMFVIPSVTPNLPQTPVAIESGALCQPKKAYDATTDNKFLSWWLTPAAQTPWSQARGDVSANPKVTIPDASLNSLTKQVNTSGYLLVNRFFDAVSPSVLTASLDAFGAFMQNPNSYQSQLASIQKAAASGSTPTG
jgi:multiple sugar transport system substrate-binding protein